MSEQSLTDFIANWNEDENNVKPLFQAIHACLATLDQTSLAYKGRSGISHSLRAKHDAQKERELFVLVDVIDDEPEARWLSICFYADLITDPEERGDIVPGGLMGADACCFDIEEADTAMEQYILARLREAHVKAAAE